MRFIELTDINDNSKVCVCLNRILLFFEDQDTKGTTISFQQGSLLFVKESYKHIYDRINEVMEIIKNND